MRHRLENADDSITDAFEYVIGRGWQPGDGYVHGACPQDLLELLEAIFKAAYDVE